MSEPGERPTLRVIRGDATDEEVAAIVALLAARGGGGDETPRHTAISVWSAKGFGHRHVRGVFHTGRHGWRTSFWPR